MVLGGCSAQSIIVAEIEYVFVPDNPLYAKRIAGL
jgi:hypothetical protein